jgi:tetratricopeptide (TPR) repeat protein
MSGLRRLVLAYIAGLIVIAAVIATGLHRANGAEQAALAQARAQRAKGDDAGALATLLACGRNPKACRCADEAEELSVDLGRYDDALHAVGSRECNAPRDLGARAEALVASGRKPEGVVEAAIALARSPAEPHANFAKGWALSAAGFAQEALAPTEAAVRGGRGVPALLLLATLRAQAGDSRGSHDAIGQAARLAPDNARVAFDTGVVAQSEGRYRDAREAYLRALALDPRMADARYNLVVLTHSIKADDEARHHLDVLAAIAPGDPRIPALRVALSKP